MARARRGDPAARRHGKAAHGSACRTIRAVTRSLSIGGAALALALAGCGGGGTASPASAQSAAQQLLEQRDVARYASGTPARALLDWWRSTQFADTPAYRESFVPALR